MQLEELLKICDFKSFPFDLKPNVSPDVWAGRQEVLKELGYFMSNVIDNRLAEFGIISGGYGSGKSQTLLHLRFMVNEQAKNKGYQVLCAYIPNPVGLGAKQSFVENYQYVVSQGIGQETISKICRACKDAIQTSASENMTKEELQAFLRDTSGQEIRYKKVFNELMSDPPIPYELLGKLIDQDAEAWQWISGQKAHNNIGGVSVQPVTSHIVCARTLAQIITLATKSPTKAKETACKASFILVDQAENIAQLDARAYQEHIAGWRTIIDEIGNSFGLLWAMDGRAEDILGNFSEPIQRRLTIDPRKFALESLYDDEPREFLEQIIGVFRQPGSTVPIKTYPFTKDALDEIVNLTSNKTPSNLLTACRRVFTRAASDDIVMKKGDLIEADYVTKSV